MNSRTIIPMILSALFYLGSQLLIFNHFFLGDYALCFSYILFILVLPIKFNHYLLMIFGFISGLFVDIFQDTLGIHACAACFLGFVRPYLLNLIEPNSGYNEYTSFNIESMGLSWSALYIFLGAFVHHLVLFIVESSKLDLLFQSIYTAFLSSITTLSVGLLLQALSRNSILSRV